MVAKKQENVASMDALMTKLAESKKEQMNLRFQLTAGQLKNTDKLKKTRREIARIETKISALKNATSKKGA